MGCACGAVRKDLNSMQSPGYGVGRNLDPVDYLSLEQGYDTCRARRARGRVGCNVRALRGYGVGVGADTQVVRYDCKPVTVDLCRITNGGQVEIYRSVRTKAG